MTSPEQRREAHLKAIGTHLYCRNTYRQLLDYFDFEEPEVADLIRHGRDRESTGIKDRNGQFIRVGDIVETWADLSRSYVRVVVRETDRPEIAFKPRTGFILCTANSRHFEVLGNIYEDKDLIPASYTEP
jgi:hypothetical protein